MGKQITKRGAVKFRVEKLDGQPMWDAILVVNGKAYHGLASMPEVAVDQLCTVLAQGDENERLMSLVPFALWVDGEKDSVKHRFGIPPTSTEIVLVGR